MEISRKTFEDNATSDKSRQLMLFDAIMNIDKKLDEIPKTCAINTEACNKRFKKLERWNKATSTIGGAIGGFIAIITSKIFGVN